MSNKCQEIKEQNEYQTIGENTKISNNEHKYKTNSKERKRKINNKHYKGLKKQCGGVTPFFLSPTEDARGFGGRVGVYCFSHANRAAPGTMAITEPLSSHLRKGPDASQRRGCTQ